MIRKTLLCGWMLTLALVLVGCSDNSATKETAKPAAKVFTPIEPPKPPAVTDSAESTEGTKDIDVIPPKPPGVKDTKPTASAISEKTAGKSASARPTTIRVLKLDEYERQIAAMKGKIVVVDAWATWCVPCVTKFPKFVEMSKKHAKDNVVFVTLSGDGEDGIEAAREFLAEQGGDLKNFLVTDEISDVQDKLGFEGLPQYFLYGSDGALAAKADKLEEIEQKLADLLKKG